MTKCFFCGKEEYAHNGVHLIKNDGSVQFFCSSKCRKNTLKLRRDKRKVKWTDAYDVAKDKEAASVQRAEQRKEDDQKRKEDSKNNVKDAKKEKKVKAEKR